MKNQLNSLHIYPLMYRSSKRCGTVAHYSSARSNQLIHRTALWTIYGHHNADIPRIGYFSDTQSCSIYGWTITIGYTAKCNYLTQNHKAVEAGKHLWRTPSLSSLFKVGSLRLICPGLCPFGFWIPVRTETPQPFRTSCNFSMLVNIWK